MTKEEAYRYIDNLKWLKGYDNTTISGKTVGEILDEIKTLLKEQEPKQVETDMYGNAYCPWCSTDRTIEMGLLRLHLGTQFCPYCGKAVKWND